LSPFAATFTARPPTAGWPASGLVVLGIFLGLDLLMFGLFWLVLALALREIPA
jgi:uncharacterized membrane protein HdeD (DUF308 family)